MPRPLVPIILGLAWLFGLAFLGVAWGAEASPDAVLAIPGPAGSVALNLGDLTFPGAVLAGFWMLARALPVALRSWTPTLRVELVQVDRGDDDPR
jgi:hypothetical protein